MFLIFRTFEELPERIDLNREETEHLRARRLLPGAPLHIGDGICNRYVGVLEPDRGGVRIDPLPVETLIDPVRIICTAVPSGKRWDWLIQKGVELGATHFVPVRFERSERKGIAEGRAGRIIVEAASQSRRFFLPQILPEVDAARIPETIEGIAAGNMNASRIFVLHPGGDFELSPRECGDACAFVIGPEGGFTLAEVERFKELGFTLRGIGRNILRVETAALAALAIASVS